MQVLLRHVDEPALAEVLVAARGDRAARRAFRSFSPVPGPRETKLQGCAAHCAVGACAKSHAAALAAYWIQSPRSPSLTRWKLRQASARFFVHLAVDERLAG